jgi:long-chain acyl-CoA synthetase
VDKSPLIDQIIIYNNQSPFTSAIVVPNREAVRSMLGGKDDEESLAKVAQAIYGEVDKYRTGGIYADEFPDRWLPGALAIVGEPFTEQNGLVNSTMKIVRGKVEEYFADRIEYVYTPEGKKAANPKNLESIKQIAK